MALCCRQSAISPRAHGLTNARWQLVHGASDPGRPKTIAQRCGATISGTRVGRLGFLKPFEDPEFLATTTIAAEASAPEQQHAINARQNTAAPCGRASRLCTVIGTGDDGTSLSVPFSASTART